MKVAMFSSKAYEKLYFSQANQNQHKFIYLNEPLSLDTAMQVQGCTAICCFVTDCLDATVIAKLVEMKISLIALRSAGYDHVDLKAAQAAGITVCNVPNYSPQAVAEFATGIILMLARKFLLSYQQGLTLNFSLDNLLGFNLYGKTIGIIGTGKIGTAFATIMHGFGCKLLACDPFENAICKNLGVSYVALDELLAQADIISLHCPLNENTRHIIEQKALAKIKKGAMLINTGRGALIDTTALINALETGQLGYAGLDVYEKEKDLFFIDHHGKAINDPQFLKLRALSNVIITPHQAFLTKEAITRIAQDTIANINAYRINKPQNTLSFKG